MGYNRGRPRTSMTMIATACYVKSVADFTKLNSSKYKPAGLTITIK